MRATNKTTKTIVLFWGRIDEKNDNPKPTKPMNTKTLAAALLLFGSAVAASTQATPVAANYGDIILGFETTGGNSSGGTQNLLIDLGNYAGLASFTNINIASDLSAVFGLGWSNTVSYGAYGTAFVVHWTQNYLTAPSGQAAFNPLSTGNTTAKVDSKSLYDLYNLQLTNGVTTADGVTSSSTVAGAWGTFTPSTSPFGVSSDQNIETTLGTGLNLFNRSYLPNTVNATPYSILVDAAGNLSVSAVPEPSTYVLFGLGALVLGIALRRKSQRLPNISYLN